MLHVQCMTERSHLVTHRTNTCFMKHMFTSVNADTTGITERFGEDVFERLQKDGQIPLTWHKDWILTKEVCTLWQL